MQDIYIYIYIYICNHENNVPSWLSPQWLCGNTCTWAHDVRLYIYIYIYMESTPSSMKGFFSKEFFMRGLLGKISEEGLLYMVGTNDQICQKRSFINGFSNNLNTVNLFPNHVRVFTWRLSPDQNYGRIYPWVNS